MEGEITNRGQQFCFCTFEAAANYLLRTKKPGLFFSQDTNLHPGFRTSCIFLSFCPIRERDFFYTSKFRSGI